MNAITVKIPAGSIELEGDMVIPPMASGIVVFAHGSGSSRFSPRNGFVAQILQQRGVATLLFDLLSRLEDQDRSARFDIALLTDRLLAATAWLQINSSTENLKIGYFGASTGAASALQAAARKGANIAAVVSRGGRPDLAGADALSRVIAPTLLIVGGDDHGVVELNEQAYALLECKKEFVIIPGATHLFDEPGTLEKAAKLAVDWFLTYL
ncbi:alpha/beta hydrolase [Nitrosomonas sp. JL21]|uniref:dienelactone hydrolase family protein n=1 Tax=Nitrosomonas sp. JL21 TaxID=153949 RepID=UPI00136ADD4D|nr:dienelactone hydrolase family protein [Nitrosomonas sp. JL21]MBL8498769.1 dienelactone hydrolase family protein [Nitrosomonas sp.]MCC7092080.1 dienelactone hydrolase family protein [Nitrosomonas sp.]MXS78061.1 alpha/beta hydrolase [Nitrosomonas sp. JL21]